jgi:hypothetical protein
MVILTTHDTRSTAGVQTTEALASAVAKPDRSAANGSSTFSGRTHRGAHALKGIGDTDNKLIQAHTKADHQGQAVDLGGIHIDPARRWAVQLDTGTLVFVNTDHLVAD